MPWLTRHFFFRWLFSFTEGKSGDIKASSKWSKRIKPFTYFLSSKAGVPQPCPRVAWAIVWCNGGLGCSLVVIMDPRSVLSSPYTFRVTKATRYPHRDTAPTSAPTFGLKSTSAESQQQKVRPCFPSDRRKAHNVCFNKRKVCPQVWTLWRQHRTKVPCGDEVTLKMQCPRQARTVCDGIHISKFSRDITWFYTNIHDLRNMKVSIFSIIIYISSMIEIDERQSKC